MEYFTVYTARTEHSTPYSNFRQCFSLILPPTSKAEGFIVLPSLLNYGVMAAIS